MQNWFEFKNLLYDIYDHRIANAPEINGGINTNYMGMEHENNDLEPYTKETAPPWRADLAHSTPSYSTPLHTQHASQKKTARLNRTGQHA